MRHKLPSVAIAAMLFFSPFYAFCFQDSTRYHRDSLKQEIQVTPFFKTSQRSSGNYIGVVDDTLTFLRSSGISVLNTLRDVVPNSGISVNAPFANVRRNMLFVIDGVPYEESPGIYNPNTFEYQSVTMLSRANAASMYGPYSGNGAVLLKSKTGENYHKPSVEFSSYATTISSLNIGSSLYWSNAVAYMQDFGKFDTRVSYSHVKFAGDLGNANNLKINTGLDLSPKFKARMIVDYVNTTRSDYSFSSSTSYKDSLLIQDGDTMIVRYDPRTIERHNYLKSKQRLLRGNIVLQYQPFRWLTFTSQGSLGKRKDTEKHDYNIDHITSTFTEEHWRNHRLTNIFAKIHPRIGRQSEVSGFAGFQYQSWKHTGHLFEGVTVIGSNLTSYRTKSFISGIGFNLGEVVYGQYVHRRDLQSMYVNGGKQSTSSVSMSFVFSDAFGLQTPFFSIGKIRGSLGKSHVIIENQYERNPTFPKESIETGTDLLFFNNRLGLTFNYFNEDITGTPMFSPSIRIGDLKIRGTEFLLTSIPIKGRNIEYKAVLMWMKTKAEIKDQRNSNPIGIGNSFPNWTGSLFNEVTWKNLSLSFLVDVRNGGTYYADGQPSLSAKGSQMKLRDVSFGWFIIRKPESKFKQLHLTLSVRNTTLLYSSSGRDIETYVGNVGNNVYSENMSLGLSGIF